MPAASKTELMKVTGEEFAKLSKLISLLSDDQALTPDAEGLTIKDIIAHRAHWIDLFLGWYTDGLAGRAVYFPAKGYKWNDLKRYNRDLREDQAGLGWPEACAMLASSAQKLEDFIEGLDDPALYGGPMKGARNTWTTGRWAEAAGPSHYRSASKYIRARTKVFKAAG